MYITKMNFGETINLTVMCSVLWLKPLSITRAATTIVMNYFEVMSLSGNNDFFRQL